MPDSSATTMTPAAMRILAAADELFYARGITAVGVDAIAEHAGATKRTLYDRFTSKERLVALYLERRDARWRAQVEAAIAASPDAVGAVTAPFDALDDWMRDADRGCAFVNALAELPDPAHPGHRVAVASKEWLRSRFATLAETAGVQRPRDLAARLLLLHEGVLAMHALPGDAMATARDLAHELVAGAGAVAARRR